MRIAIVLLLHVVLTGVVQSTTVLSLGTSHDLITTDQTECTGSLHDLHENDAEVWSEVLHPKPFYRFFLYKRAVTQWTEVVPKNVQTRPPRDMNRAKHHPRLGFRLVRYYQFPVFDAAKIETLGEGRPKPSYHEFPMNKRFDMMRPVPETPERLQAQQEDDDLLAELVKVTPLPAQCMYRGEDLAAPHDIPSLPYDRAPLSTEDYTYTAAQSRRFEVSMKDYQNECTPLSDPAGPRLCVFNIEFEILFRRYPVDSEIQEWLQLANNLGSTSKEEFLQHYTTSVFAHQRVVFSLSGDDPNSVGTDPGSKSHAKKEDSLESFERDVESERAAYKDAFIIADVETLIKRRRNLKKYQYFTHRAHLKAAVPVGNSASSQPGDPLYLYLTVVFRSLDFRLIHLLKLNLQFLKASTFFPSGWLDIDARPLEEAKIKFEILQSENVTHPEQVHNIMVPVRKKYERYNQLLPKLIHQFIARIVENLGDMPPILNHPRMRQLRMKLIAAQSQKCTLHVRAIIFLVGYATYFTIHVVTTNGAITLQEDVFAVRSGAAKSEGVIQAIAYSVEVPTQGGYTHSVFFRFETERPIFLIYPHAFLLENITKWEVEADNLKLEVQSIVEQLGTQLTDPITKDIIVHPFKSKKHRVTNISPLLKIEYPNPKRQGGHLAARVLSQVPEKQMTMYHYYLVQHHHHHHHHFHTKYLTRNYIWSHVPDRKASTSSAGWYVILITSIVTFVNVMCGTLFIILHSKRSVRAR